MRRGNSHQGDQTPLHPPIKTVQIFNTFSMSNQNFYTYMCSGFVITIYPPSLMISFPSKTKILDETMLPPSLQVYSETCANGHLYSETTCIITYFDLHSKTMHLSIKVTMKWPPSCSMAINNIIMCLLTCIETKYTVLDNKCFMEYDTYKYEHTCPPSLWPV